MRLSRRHLLQGLGVTLMSSPMRSGANPGPATGSDSLEVFLCGDVMTARGIDQALAHPGDPKLHEPWVKDARRYVKLAEHTNGPIPRPVPSSYIWGDALTTMSAADIRVINLETAVTKAGQPAAKGIHYRMHPKNIGCITAAGVDCCVLANNHVLDWGEDGLIETLEVLHDVGIATAGAGRIESDAVQPAICDHEKTRVLVFGLGMIDSGIPASWEASGSEPGVHLLSPSKRDIGRFAEVVKASRKSNDIVIASIHWGGNWGYPIPDAHRALAHRVIEEADVDVVHGHSSHHVKGIEVFRGKLILYGCGDFINDYEGIGGHERYRPDLTLGYVASIRPADGKLEALHMSPFQIHRFRLREASKADARWLRDRISREGKPLGSRVELQDDGRLVLVW